jgi:5-carboxymethyl-2-hydroxymuconate isomerase
VPHCIIEYSKNLKKVISIDKLIDCAFESIVQADLFDPKAIKVRAKAYKYYKSGLERNEFIHISIRILQGRTSEQKAALSALVQSTIVPLVGNTKSVSVEIIDMNTASYNKRVSDI